jgi:peptide/nickel transport system permease protein
MLYGLIIVGFWLLISLLAPIIAPHSPTHPFVGAVLAPPSRQFLLGTDSNGLDILSRLMWAPRIDLGIAVASTILAVLIGVPLGGFAGYFSGRRGLQGGLATVAMRIVDISQAFPVFVFALAIVAALGPHAVNLVIAMAFVNAPVFIWLTRSQVLAVRERAFVEAARCGGNSELRIAFRHVLPNALAAPLTQLSVVLGFSVLLTAGLSFVGAGIQLPTPEWGLMVAEGASTMITGQWWATAYASTWTRCCDGKPCESRHPRARCPVSRQDDLRAYPASLRAFRAPYPLEPLRKSRTQRSARSSRGTGSDL